MSARIPLGPSLTGTLVAGNCEATVAAYCDYLSTTVLEDTEISETEAVLWGKPKMAGSRIVTLVSPSGYPWVRVISNPGVISAKPFKELGWMALEVLVQDVDDLALRLQDSPFEIFRSPADLGASDDTRSMQVIGPAGEVLYLTQINAEVPPFKVPQAVCDVDRLFIPVSTCLRRVEALSVYSKLGANQNWCFDTRISSINKAHGLQIDMCHPVATVQLAGSTLVEIDQLGVAKPRPPAAGGFPAGILMVSFVFDNVTNIGVSTVSPAKPLTGKMYGGQAVVVCRGAGGELIELIQAAR